MFFHKFVSVSSACAMVIAAFAPLATFAAPSVGDVSPGNATANVAVTLSANVSSGAGITSCNLYVDLVDVGAMSVAGGAASKSHTFTAGGSHTAFVFCRDNAGTFGSGPYTAIWVEGTITQQAPGLPAPSGSPTISPDAPLSIPLAPTPPPPPTTNVLSGTLVKLACPANAAVDHPCKAVYFLGADGKRHAFPNSKTYHTWFADFSAVTVIDATSLSNIALGKNVTYRPGVRMVKFQTENKVYTVSQGGLLRWVASEELARGIYGTTWNTQIDEIPDAFYTNYAFGTDIQSPADYSPDAAARAAETVDMM